MPLSDPSQNNIVEANVDLGVIWPKTETVYRCPVCNRRVVGGYNLDTGRKNCSKTWHKAVPVGAVYTLTEERKAEWA